MSPDCEIEPVPGLPAPLPAGETILWQGAPDWRALANRACHLPTLALYFAGLAIWRVTALLGDGAGAGEALLGGLLLVGLGLAALGLLAGYAFLSARTALYTITNRRVVLRVGIALPLTVNLPFASIASAGLKLGRAGRGDITLAMSARQRIGYLLLWPHVRPWRFTRAEPMLRAIPDAESVANILGRALASAASMPVTAMAAAPLREAGGHGAQAAAA